MNFIKGFFSLISGVAATDSDSDSAVKDEILDNEGNTRSDIESYILSELERRRDERRDIELQWQLNANFLYGNQRCDINIRSHTVEQYSDPCDGLEKEIYNQIEPLAKTRAANLGKISYAMTVKPRTSEIDDISKAKVSTSILRYKQSTSDFSRFITSLIHWAEITGTAFVLNWWDTRAGDMVGEITTLEEDDYGQPAEKKEAVFSGDVNYGMLTPFEVFPETVYKETVEDQRSIITEQVMSVEDIYDIYGIKVDGRAIETYALSPVEGAGGFGYVATVAKMTSHTVTDSEKVITYFERPGRKFPNGRMAILIGDKLYRYSKLPYRRIPIVSVKSDVVAGRFFGRSFIQSEIPLQRAYNGLMNSVHDYAKRLSFSTPIVEEGSVDDMDEFLDNVFIPGQAITYKQGYSRPQFMELPSFPSNIHTQIEKIKNDMEYTAGVSQLMVYGQKSGVTSGAAIDSLTEIDNTRLSITGENIRAGILGLAKLWLEMYKTCASGYRVLKIAGSNDAGDVLVWCSDDINSYDVVYDAVNELIYSEESQRQNFISAYNMGLFADENGMLSESFKATALEKMKIGDFTSMLGIKELHRKKAERENALLRFGVLPVIDEIDDHALHVETHETLVLQLEYQTLKAENPELCEKFEEHIKLHKGGMIANRQAAVQNDIPLGTGG